MRHGELVIDNKQSIQERLGFKIQRMIYVVFGTCQSRRMILENITENFDPVMTWLAFDQTGASNCGSAPLGTIRCQKPKYFST